MVEQQPCLPQTQEVVQKSTLAAEQIGLHTISFITCRLQSILTIHGRSRIVIIIALHLTAPSNDEEPAPRSLRPGQKGFAERLMSKYGWTKGTGLGATGSGIINPLRVQVEKQQKKKAVAGDGDVGASKAASINRGKIIGGKKKKTAGKEDDEEEGMFGKMSEVVVLKGMVDGLDLDAELLGPADGDGGLMQEIGEECGEKVSILTQPLFMFAYPTRSLFMLSLLYSISKHLSIFCSI